MHAHLKPQNILITTRSKRLYAKLSDVGISERIHGSRDHPGWQAPEQIVENVQTQASDLFNLGCIIFFCLTKGKHPFGKYADRNLNITNNKRDLSLVESNHEAYNLISQLLNPIPHLRYM